MLRSLFAGISGLRTHQQMIDVTGNNIANVNTTGYKSAQATFQDTLSQMVQAAAGPQAGNGGTNPAQVGLGARLGNITNNFGQGASQSTGRNSDLMIQGDGFFVVTDGQERLYTRNGSFSFDASGLMTTSGGGIVQGWQAGANGIINTNDVPGAVSLPIGVLLEPSPTQNALFGGNLPGDRPVGTSVTTSQTGYGQAGVPVNIGVTFTKATATTWGVSFDGGATTSATLTFDADGELVGPAGGIVAFNADIDLNLSAMTAYAGLSTINPISQDGAAMGSLSSYTISNDGVLTGIFSNGLKRPLAQLALATFNNAQGLEKVGESMFRNTVNSGPAALGIAGTGGRGVLQAGALEMSNVDLGAEFTNLVIAQRGFQANSRVITTSDELLQDLVNIKR
ncbi:MAG TPA: flagellar hook protein FlgE [Pilimelia sp.]|nr:flagellar hook protein FlgE [Pilimelia sp.]